MFTKKILELMFVTICIFLTSHRTTHFRLQAKRTWKNKKNRPYQFIHCLILESSVCSSDEISQAGRSYVPANLHNCD